MKKRVLLRYSNASLAKENKTYGSVAKNTLHEQL